MNIAWITLLHRPFFHLPLLLIIGLLAFGANISLSLFMEAEGIYAMVTYAMVERQDYVNLMLRGWSYSGKPPLFFWLQAGFIHVLGWSEAALRLPSVLASLGTMLLTYGLGRLWFSPVAGFWGALVVATCYAGLWFGPLGIIDPVLTFCMTLGMYAWARAYFSESSRWWYVLGFVALALGSMVKNLHALALPILMLGVFLWMRRDHRVFRDMWFWLGVLVSSLMLGGYYLVLGQEFSQRFFFDENLKRLIAVSGDRHYSMWEAYWGSRPLYWYALVIWFDAFPWSAVLPVGLVLLWKRRPWLEAPKELWVFLWFAVYLGAMSVVPEKHERYLLPLLPAIGVIVGYVYHRMFVEESLSETRKLVRGLLGGLGVACVVGMFLGPLLLHRKWQVPLDMIPLTFRVGLGIGGLTLLGMAVKNRVRWGLLGVGVVGMLLTVTVTRFIIPGIHGDGAPREVWKAHQRGMTNPTDPIAVFQTLDWRGDEDEFYWNYLHGHSRIVGQDLDDALALEELKQEVQEQTPFVVLMTEDQYNRLLSGDPDLKVEVLLEFYRAKKKIVLLDLRWNKRPESFSKFENP